MSYMKYRPRDRHAAGEILTEFAALLAKISRERAGATQPTAEQASDTPAKRQSHD